MFNIMGSKGIVIAMAVVWVLLISLLIWYYFFKGSKESSTIVSVVDKAIIEDADMIEQLA